MAGTASTVTGARTSDPQARPGTSALHLVFPPELRRSFVLRAGETTLGRDPGEDGLALDHRTVSRLHATLTWSPGLRSHAVRDLGSRNGTRADGLSALEGPRTLVPGSVLRLGDVLLVYEQGLGPEEPAPRVSFEALPGTAGGIRQLRARLARAAADPSPVLIVGETGTGKERIAAELHRLSGRRGKLVALNCATLSAQIAESQLFGHARGAFTGASEAQPGLFRAAQGGTLFLDEIGELPPDLQPKLLRVLQEGEVLPVGASQAVPVDVRIVAATHRDLPRACREGSFREDLYARLSLWELPVPPLRQRRVDLFDWITRLHRRWATRRGLPGELRFDPDAAETLLRFAWPLNLRGVERLVHELGVVSARSPLVGRAALPSWLAADVPDRPVEPTPAPGPPVERDPVPTREEFIRAFGELGGSVHALARRFRRDRRQIYRWLEAHGLGDRRPRARS